MTDLVGCAAFNALVEKVDGLPVPDGSETKVTQGSNVKVSGAGTTAAPYVISGLYPETGAQIPIDSPVAIVPAIFGYLEKRDPLTGEIQFSSAGRKLYLPLYSDDSVIQLTDIGFIADPLGNLRLAIKKTSNGNPMPAAGVFRELAVDGVSHLPNSFVLDSVLYGFSNSSLTGRTPATPFGVPITFTDFVGNKYAGTGSFMLMPQ